jgi:hypothetical protein
VLSVISSSSRCGGRPVSASTASTEAAKSLQQLAHRQVDRHAHLRQAVAHELLQLRAGGAQHPVAELVDDAGFLGQRMNSAGGIMPRTGWRQRTSASMPMMRPLLRQACGW